MKICNVRSEPTEFKYVDKRIANGKEFYYMQVKIGRHGKGASKCYPTAREAAIAVDVYLIKNGKQPVNILKPKK